MRRFIAAAVLLAASAAAAAAADLGQAEQIIARRTNEFRLENGLARLEVDARLNRAAEGFAQFMARSDRYGHAADGRQPAERAQAQGYEYCLVSENISYQFSGEDFGTEELARRFVEGWKNSPGHRRNMVEPDVVHMATAVARSAQTGRYYGVQVFGRPRDRSIEFHVRNLARATVRYRVGTEDFSLNAGQERIHTVCKPPTVTFPDAANAEGRTFRPSSGERLRIEGGKRHVVRSER
jgi:uncharacterized protein YkwD